MRTLRNSLYFGIGVLIAMIICLHASADILPNAALTPGVSRVVDLHTLCTTSTKLVRNVPPSEKMAVYKSYSLKGNHTGYCDGVGGCEIDHLISLELGGSNDIGNLWPQPYFNDCNAHQKDLLENKLHELVCDADDSIPLAEAQLAISTDWISAYTKYVNPNGCSKPVIIRSK